MIISPQSLYRIPEIIYNKVDLPLPEKPTTPNVCPSCTSKEMLFKTFLELYDFDKFLTIKLINFPYR